MARKDNGGPGSNPSEGNDQHTKAPDNPAWQFSSPAELIMAALEALLGERPGVAAQAATLAMERASQTEKEILYGWGSWLIGLSQLYTNYPEKAQVNVQVAQELALKASQPQLAMAAYLGAQLISSHQQQNDLRRHEADLRQQAEQLRHQINQRELQLSLQFRAIIALAMDSVPDIIGQTTTLSKVPRAQLQTVAITGTPHSQPQLPPLEIRCFGEFQVFRGGEEINFKTNRKPSDIFKYLLAHRERAVSTDTLLGRLWPDVVTNKGMHRLHLNISTLRNLLNPPSLDKKDVGYIVTGSNSYYLNPQIAFEVDVDQFSEHNRQALALEKAGRIDDCVLHLEAAVALYRDDFLIENLYDDWTSSIRDFMRQTYIDILGKLSAYYLRSGRYPDAITSAKKMLDKDEYREDAYCYVMRALVNLNQRNQALLQYQNCVDVFDHDLGVAPMPATTELYNRIKNGEPV